jgi:WS/DGAT/MGAT family acyltransferase
VAAATDLSRRLSALDASFLYFERPTQPMHVASAITFESPLDYERVVNDLGARLHLVPRYTERVMGVPLGLAHPTWEPDPDFDIRAHVQHRSLRPPGTDEQLAELCAALYAQPLDRTRPLWEIYVVDGYRGSGVPFRRPDDAGPRLEPCGAPRSTLFVKVHHCMIDGVSGVQLMGVLLDTAPNPPPIPGPGTRRTGPLPGVAHRFLDALVDRLRTGLRRGVSALELLARPGQAVGEIRQTTDAVAHLMRTLVTSAPRTPFNGRLGIARNLAWATFSLNEIKAIKNRLGGSMNDVVLAVISGAMRRVLADRGMSPERIELRAAIPVNVRGTHEHLKLGNQVSMMVAPLPVGILDPVERLRQVRAATALLKAGDDSGKAQRLVRLIELLPPPVHQLFGRAQSLAAPVNTICTNVPGPPVSLYMQGVRVDRMVPFVPLANPVGLAFAILSYADTLTISATADAALAPDLREVIAPLHTSFEELWAATGLSRVSHAESVRPERQRRRGPIAVGGGPVVVGGGPVVEVVGGPAPGA